MSPTRVRAYPYREWRIAENRVLRMNLLRTGADSTRNNNATLNGGSLTFALLDTPPENMALFRAALVAFVQDENEPLIIRRTGYVTQLDSFNLRYGLTTEERDNHADDNAIVAILTIAYRSWI
jgi:hypothetical protein